MTTLLLIGAVFIVISLAAELFQQGVSAGLVWWRHVRGGTTRASDESRLVDEDRSRQVFDAIQQRSFNGPAAKGFKRPAVIYINGVPVHYDRDEVA